MLRHLKLPKKLRTVHHPGNFVEIWMNNQKVDTLTALNNSEQSFIKQFINNLEDLGWNVLVKK